ncbi:hypothetical protein CGC20_27295 [Leishmania donovani]|uniref:C6H2-type domain-containing protein n=1 Tax=Leishmania donovani TaxID=5661 RepID=A0A504XWA6_LEIDO|nr:hypothetical protein CGC20_27295 [Leishmania donovani]
MTDTAAPRQVACQGCSTQTTTAFQCPLCQAEATADCGFFCTQECFAKNWLKHRNTLHKSGVVRKTKRMPADAAAAAPAGTTEKGRQARGGKRSRAADEAASGTGKDTCADKKAAAGGTLAPWPPLPNAAVCKKNNWAQVTPELPLDVPRAVVRPVVTEAAKGSAEQPLQRCMWPAMLAAAQYVALSAQRNTAPSAVQVLVVAGDVQSAHAFAWAARCVGLAGTLQLAVSEQPAQSSVAAATKNSSSNTASTAAATAASPSRYFTSHRCIVIATSAVVRASALARTSSSTAVSGAASLWLTGAPSHSLLVTLPDVVDAEDLQGVQTRAVFFTGPAGPTSDDAAKDDGNDGVVSYTYTSLEVLCEDRQPLCWKPAALSAPGSSTPSSSTAGNGGAAAAAASCLDDEVCTCFANGDMAAALQRLVRCYQHQPGHLESKLYYTLCCNWGAASLVHAHHRLAYVARFLCDRSVRFEAPKNATLADAALRAIAAVCRLLPRMADVEAEAAAAAANASGQESASDAANKSKKRRLHKSEVAAAAPYAPSLASTTRPTPVVASGVSAPSAQEVARYANYYTHLPNLQLQATVCHLHPIASPAVLDTFAMAWGLYRYLPGPSSLDGADHARSAAVHRVRQRFTAKLDSANGVFYVILMHLIYDAVGPYSLPVDEVNRRLQWDLTLAHDAGSLEAYLRCCGLLVADDGLLLPTSSKQRVRKMKKGGRAASVPAVLSSRLKGSRETTQSRTEQLRCFAVKSMAGTAGAAAVASSGNYGVIELPWKTFPITGERQRQVARLHQAAVEELLMAMPRVPRPMYIGDVGNLIGKWMHFNSRFDGTLGVNLQAFLEQHPEAFKVLDNIVTRRTAGKTEQLLTGQRLSKSGGKGIVELPARARKKRAIKEFNKERFNRNYKSIDPSARVPGYIKRGPRRIKGRGKKANKHNERSFLRNLIPMRVYSSGPPSIYLRHAFLNQDRLIRRFLGALETVPLPSLPRMLLAEGFQRMLEGDVPQRELRELFEDAEVECRKMLLHMDVSKGGHRRYHDSHADPRDQETWHAVRHDPLRRLLAHELRAACSHYARLMAVSSSPYVPAAVIVRTIIASDVRTDNFLVKMTLAFERHPRNVETGERVGEAMPPVVEELMKELLLLERDAFGCFRFDPRGDNHHLVHSLKLADMTKTPRSFSIMRDPLMKRYGNYRVECEEVHKGRWNQYKVHCGPEDHRIDPALPLFESVVATDPITGGALNMLVHYDEPICLRHKHSSREEKGNFGHTEVFELAMDVTNRTFWERYFLDR